MRTLLVLLALCGCTTPGSSDDSALTARVAALELAKTQDEVDLAAATTRITTLETSLAAANTQIGAAATQIAALQAQFSSLTTSVTSAQADVGDLQEYAEAISTSVGDLSASVGGSAAWLGTETTWTVGPSGDYPTLEEAWAAAQGVSLAPGATLDIRLLDGEHTLAATLELDHPDGDRITISGSESGNVTLHGPGDADALVVSAGHHLAAITGLTLEGPGTTKYGITVRDGSWVGLDDVVITDFNTGLRIQYGAYVDAFDVGLHDNYYGTFVWGGAVMEAEGLVATANSIGVYAEYGGVVVAPGLDASGNLYNGVIASEGGILFAEGLDVTGAHFGAFVANGGMFGGTAGHYGEKSGGLAVVANGLGSIDVSGSTISNTLYGILSLDDSVVQSFSLDLDNVTTPYSADTGGIINY